MSFIGTLRARGSLIIGDDGERGAVQPRKLTPTAPPRHPPALGSADPRAQYLKESKLLLEIVLMESRGKALVGVSGNPYREERVAVTFQDALDELEKWTDPETPYHEDEAITNPEAYGFAACDKDRLAKIIRDCEVSAPAQGRRAQVTVPSSHPT